MATMHNRDYLIQSTFVKDVNQRLDGMYAKDTEHHVQIPIEVVVVDLMELVERRKLSEKWMLR